MVYLNRVLIRKSSILIGFLEILIGYFTQIRSLSRALINVLYEYREHSAIYLVFDASTEL